MSLFNSLKGKMFKSSTRKKRLMLGSGNKLKKRRRTRFIRSSPKTIVMEDLVVDGDKDAAEDPVKTSILNFLYGTTSISPQKLREALTSISPPPLATTKIVSPPPTTKITAKKIKKIIHADGEYSVTFTTVALGFEFGESTDDHTKLGYEIRAVCTDSTAFRAGVQAGDRLIALGTLQARDMTTESVGQFIRTSARPLTLRFLEKDQNPTVQTKTVFVSGIQTNKAIFNPRHLDAAGLLQCKHPVTPTREYLATLKRSSPFPSNSKNKTETNSDRTDGTDGTDGTDTNSTSNASSSLMLSSSSPSSLIPITEIATNTSVPVKKKATLLTPALMLEAATSQNSIFVQQSSTSNNKKPKKKIRAKKPKVPCPYCGEIKRTKSNGSSKGKYLRKCMNTECSARFYRVDPITFEASVLNNGNCGPVKHVILKKTLNKKKKK
jgi:hypothetical protein